MILIMAFVIIVVVKRVKTKTKKEGYSVENAAAVPITDNQAYGLTYHDHSKENIYDSPEVDLDTIEAKQNEAYATNTNITMEGNQAYGKLSNTNNDAGKNETADEYDYI